MQKYIGTKLIEAEAAVRYYMPNGSKVTVANSQEISEEEHLQLAECLAAENGYRVKYPDGYESWSPKDVFEEAYRPINGMNFGLALEAAKKGKRIARRGWNGKHQYVELATGISYVNDDGDIVNAGHAAIGNAALAFVGTLGVQLGWLASQADMLAEDWYIVDEWRAEGDAPYEGEADHA